jgi:hypothetical protein
MRRVTDFEGEIAHWRLRMQLKLSCGQNADYELSRLRSLKHRQFQTEIRAANAKRRKEKAA